MGALLTIFEEGIEMPKPPRLKPPPADSGEVLQITTTRRGVRKKRTTQPQAIRQEVAALLQDELSGYLRLFKGAPVKNSPCEGAWCLSWKLAGVATCRSSTRAELPALNVATDRLLETEPQKQPGVVILTDSRLALLRLRATVMPNNSRGYPERSLAAKLHTVAS